MNEYYTAQDHFSIVPAIMLALFGCTVLLFEFFIRDSRVRKQWLLGISFVGLAFTAGALWQQYEALSSQAISQLTGFQGSIVVDRFSLFFNAVFTAASALVLLIAYKFLEDTGEPLAEFCGLILLAQCGMYFLATGVDLITAFIGLELMAICFYVLVGFHRTDKRSNEAGLKYLLLGGFSSGFLLYGFSLFYGLAGSTKFADIAVVAAQRGVSDPILLIAITTAAVGLLFKISAVPFHMWAPDAYEGAPTPVTAYLAVASKAASLALLLRFFTGPLGEVRQSWETLLTIVAVATLTVGNLAAISQSNVKRLLAYSSISHAGYMLLGLIAGNQTGIRGIAVYVMVYMFMTIGAFLVIAAMHRQGSPAEDIDDFAGLIHRHPAYAIWMLIFLVSLAGLPPTAGFLGKYYIFLSLLETGHYALAVIGTLYVAVSLYYYFRIVRSMFTSETDTPAAIYTSVGLRVSLIATGLATIIIGVYPEPFLRFASAVTGGQP